MSSRPVTIFPIGAGTATCTSYGPDPNENVLYRFTNFQLIASENAGYVFDSFRYVTTTVSSDGHQINGNAATRRNPFPSSPDLTDPVYPCEAVGKGDEGFKSWGSSGYIAVFKRSGSSSPDLNRQTITVQSTEGGSASGGGSFLDLSLCTLTATPSEGRTFYYWTDSSGNIVSRDEIYAFIVTKSETFTAHFVEDSSSESSEDSSEESSEDSSEESSEDSSEEWEDGPLEYNPNDAEGRLCFDTATGMLCYYHHKKTKTTS